MARNAFFDLVRLATRELRNSISRRQVRTFSDGTYTWGISSSASRRASFCASTRSFFRFDWKISLSLPGWATTTRCATFVNRS
jgi:hypothetical protein